MCSTTTGSVCYVSTSGGPWVRVFLLLLACRSHVNDTSSHCFTFRTPFLNSILLIVDIFLPTAGIKLRLFWHSDQLLTSSSSSTDSETRLFPGHIFSRPYHVHVMLTICPQQTFMWTWCGHSKTCPGNSLVSLLVVFHWTSCLYSSL